MAQLKNLIVTGPSSFGQDVHCLGNGKAFKIGNANYSVGLHMGSGGANRGLYDFYKKEWMIFSNSANEVYVNGTAAMADEAEKVLHNLNTNTQFYLSGTTLTGSGQSTPCFDTGIYTDTTAGRLVVTGGIQSKANHDFIASNNEFNFIPSSYSGVVYINYKTATGEKNGALTNYVFLNGAGDKGAAGYADITAKNATFSGNLTVNGNTIIGNEATDTLTVKAAPTFSNGLTVSTGGAQITGVSKITGTFEATGASTFGSTLGVAGATTLSGALDVAGKATFTGGVKISGRYAGGGDDEGLLIGRAANGYAGVCCGDPSGVRSVFYLLPATNGDQSAVWRFNNGSGSYNITHPCKTGTIMLTSDTAVKAIADADGRNIASTYMPFAGGQFTGPVNFYNSTALPQWDGTESLPFILGISAFNNSTTGGKMHWEYADQVSVGHATNATSADQALADADGNAFSGYYCTLSTEQSLTAKKTFTQPIGVTAAANMQYNETDQCIEIVFN